MAKKKNTNALFANAVKNEQQEVTVEENKVVEEEACKPDDGKPDDGNSSSDVEMLCKNPYSATEQDIQIEELKTEVSRLTVERDRLCNEVQTLKNMLEQEDAQVKNAAALILQNTALREENDQYLMKISELTFENAKMNCQLQELSKRVETKIPQSQNAFSSQNLPPNQSRNVPYSYMPKRDMHGYESWN